MHLPTARCGEPVAHHVGDDRMSGPIGAAVFHDQSPVHQGIGDPRRVYRCRDLAPGKSVLFVATGVTSGGLLEGVRRFEGGARTMSLVMHTEPRRVRFVETIHVQEASEATGLALRF